MFALQLKTIRIKVKQMFFLDLITVATVFTTIPVVADVGSTPTGWNKIDGVYYRVVTDQRTWFESEYACQHLGGHLASFDKPVPSLRLSVNAWIGLRREPGLGTPNFSWSDGTTGDYRFWSSSKPSSGGGNCVEVIGNSNHNSGKWNNIRCSNKRAFICKVTALNCAMSLPLPPVPKLSRCAGQDADWWSFDGSCYYISRNLTTWNESLQLCKKNGGVLASVSTLEESNFLARAIEKEGTFKVYWIGMHQLDGNSFGWADGNATSFENWYYDQPKYRKKTNGCVGALRGLALWYNEDCNNVHGFICEKPKSQKIPQETHSTKNTNDCPKDFFHVGFSNKCFFLNRDKATWSEAKEACKKISWSKPTDIASVNSALDQNVASILMDSLDQDIDVWIGLHGWSNLSTFEWVDHDDFQVSFNNWAQDQPPHETEGAGKQRCVEMIGKRERPGEERTKWRVENCTTLNAYLCQTTEGTSAFEVLGHTPTGRATNFSLNTEAKSWAAAREYCRHTGDLATMANVVEHDIFDFLVLSHNVQTEVWTGLRFNKDSGQFSWSDESFLGKDFWADGQPKLLSSDERCVAYFEGNWFDRPCNMTLPFVCQNRKAPISKPSVPQNFDCSAYEEAATWGDFCYVIPRPDDTVDFANASVRCLDMGMQLVSIHSKEEAEMVRSLAESAATNVEETSWDIWIGLENHKGAFRWLDTSPMDFEHWHHKNISLRWKDEICVKMLKTGYWDQEACTENDLGYICKAAKAHTIITTPSPKSEDGEMTTHLDDEDRTADPREEATTVSGNDSKGETTNQSMFQPMNETDDVSDGETRFTAKEGTSSEDIPVSAISTPYTKGINNSEPETPYPTSLTEGDSKTAGGGEDLSAGIIAGLTVSIIVVCALGVAVFLFYRRRQNFPKQIDRNSHTVSIQNPVYN